MRGQGRLEHFYQAAHGGEQDQPPAGGHRRAAREERRRLRHLLPGHDDGQGEYIMYGLAIIGVRIYRATYTTVGTGYKVTAYKVKSVIKSLFESPNMPFKSNLRSVLTKTRILSHLCLDKNATLYLVSTVSDICCTFRRTSGAPRRRGRTTRRRSCASGGPSPPPGRTQRKGAGPAEGPAAGRAGLPGATCK